MDENKSKRRIEWEKFSEEVAEHIDTYTVSQYGDLGADNVTDWTADDCVKQMQRYVRRFGNNARDGQDKLDMMKLAHYACLAAAKL